MDVFNFVFEVLGSAFNGALQVFTDFLNLVIDVIPNPDPFPAIIEAMDADVAVDKGFVLYWIDQYIGVNDMQMMLTTFSVLAVASLGFAIVYKVTGFIKL